MLMPQGCLSHLPKHGGPIDSGQSDWLAEAVSSQCCCLAAQAAWHTGYEASESRGQSAAQAARRRGVGVPARQRHLPGRVPCEPARRGLLAGRAARAAQRGCVRHHHLMRMFSGSGTGDRRVGCGSPHVQNTTGGAARTASPQEIVHTLDIFVPKQRRSGAFPGARARIRNQHLMRVLDTGIAVGLCMTRFASPITWRQAHTRY